MRKAPGFVKITAIARLFIGLRHAKVQKISRPGCISLVLKALRRGKGVRMSKLLRIFILAALLALAVAGLAQAKDFKIGLVNMQVLVEKSDMGKLAQQNMQDEFSAERNEIAKLRQDVQTMIEDIKAQAATLTPEAKERKWMEYINMKSALDDKSREFSRKVETAERRVRKEMVGLFIIAAKSFSEKNGYSLIMDGNQSGVVFADKALDVTEEMLKEVNMIWNAANRNKAQ